jgi:hypothetical protein
VVERREKPAPLGPASLSLGRRGRWGRPQTVSAVPAFRTDANAKSTAPANGGCEGFRCRPWSSERRRGRTARSRLAVSRGSGRRPVPPSSPIIGGRVPRSGTEMPGFLSSALPAVALGGRGCGRSPQRRRSSATASPGQRDATLRQARDGRARTDAISFRGLGQNGDTSGAMRGPAQSPRSAEAIPGRGSPGIGDPATPAGADGALALSVLGSVWADLSRSGSAGRNRVAKVDRRPTGSGRPRPLKEPTRWGRAGSVLLGRRCCYEVRRKRESPRRTSMTAKS